MAQPDGYYLIENKDDYLTNIINTNSNLISLKSDFIQEKTSSLFSEKIVSKGVMYFKKPVSLRWEYQEPNQSIFILDDNQFFIKNGNNVSSNKSNLLFKEISKFIIELITGEEFKKDKKFQKSYFTNGQYLWVKMIPQNKQFSQMYSLIEVQIDSYSALADQIIMFEKNGDQTIIKFVNTRKNAIFSNDIFILK